MWQTWQAENWAAANPGMKSMLIFKFETVCNGCQFSPTVFSQFLQWLYPRLKIGTSNEKINIV